MNLASMLLAIIAGIFTTVESTINSQLGKHITPSLAALHSLMVGFVFMLFINLIRGNIAERYQNALKVNPLLLIGGLFGASIIYLSSKAIPLLGISSAVILILAGQLLSGLIIDVYVNDITITYKKMAGMILFLIGAIMFLKE